MTTLCEVCGIGEMTSGGSSLLFCTNCGAQSTTFVDEAMDAENVHMYNPVFRRDRGNVRDVEQLTQESFLDGQPITTPNSQQQPDGLHSSAAIHMTGSDQLKSGSLPLPASQLGQMLYPGGHVPDDKLAGVIRSTYVKGLQKILQLQCEALVNQFHVNPLICGIVGPIWLKYVASTRVFEAAWADEAVEVAEHRERGRKGHPSRVRQAEQSLQPSEADAEVEEPIPSQNEEPSLAPEEKATMRGSLRRAGRKKRALKSRQRKAQSDLRTSYGRQLRFVWLSALKERIPVSISLALCFLACYIAREPILPTDILKWASEGRLPYLSAFVEISKPASYHIPNTIGGKRFFPVDPSQMFRPTFLLGSRRLEVLAGFIAERICLQIPPINFHSVAGLLLRDMGQSGNGLSVYAHRLHSWYTPSGLWISGSKGALPTRVYVVAMLIIAMKVLYKLDGRTCQPVKEKLVEELVEQNLARGFTSPKVMNQGIELQPAHKMVTRAEQKRKQRAEGSNLPEVSDQTKKFGTVADSDNDSSKRNKCTSPSTTSRGDEGHKANRGKVEGSGFKFPELKATRLVEQKDFGDAEGLVRILEGIKTKDEMSDDEKLLQYLQYCQNVVFAGFDRDPAVEAAVQHCWELYNSRKEVTNIDKPERVFVSGSEEGPSSGSASGVARPFPTKEQLPTTSEDTCTGLAVQGGGRGRTKTVGGLHINESPIKSSSRSEGTGIKKTTKQKRLESRSEPTSDEKSPGGDSEFKPSKAKEVDRLSRDRPPGLSNLISDMKKAGFGYLPPLSRPVASDLYVRYKIPISADGLTAVHGDYFRVLRAFGKVINVHPKALHRCVTIIERGLLRVEGSVEKFLLGQNFDLPEDVKRRKAPRQRDKKAEREGSRSAAQSKEHLTDLSYL